MSLLITRWRLVLDADSSSTTKIQLSISIDMMYTSKLYVINNINVCYTLPTWHSKHGWMQILGGGFVVTVSHPQEKVTVLPAQHALPWKTSLMGLSIQHASNTRLFASASSFSSSSFSSSWQCPTVFQKVLWLAQSFSTLLKLAPSCTMFLLSSQALLGWPTLSLQRPFTSALLSWPHMNWCICWCKELHGSQLPFLWESGTQLSHMVSCLLFWACIHILILSRFGISSMSSSLHRNNPHQSSTDLLLGVLMRLWFAFERPHKIYNGFIEWSN